MRDYWEKRWNEINSEGYDRNNQRHREIRQNYGLSSGRDGVSYSTNTRPVYSNTGNGFGHASCCMCPSCRSRD